MASIFGLRPSSLNETSFRMRMSRPQPEKWITKDYWRLETPPASYATHDGWSNADVDVVPVEQRNWKA
jgi:NCS1 family nucleobase:cation symporter-1